MELTLPWFGSIGLWCPRERTLGTVRQRLERVLGQIAVVLFVLLVTHFVPGSEAPSCVSLEAQLPSCFGEGHGSPLATIGALSADLPESFTSTGIRSNRLQEVALPPTLWAANPRAVWLACFAPTIGKPASHRVFRIVSSTSDNPYRGRTATRTTGFVWPVQGSISSGFGARRNPVTHRHEFHPAIDIRAVYRTPVHSACDGVVVLCGPAGNLGRIVRVRSGDMLFTYAHLSRTDCRIGSTVHRGQVVGLVGASGRCTGPHLHFAVTRGSSLVNPLTILP